ncbi:MAG: hypothetical protein IJP68_11745, partial [Selenomonadaceae bacterium]|nr:hypothetical protein [Selenomonadaceae bacterium]
GGGLYSLTEPEHFTFTNTDGFRNYRGRIFATGQVTFELTADDDRRIIDELSGAEIMKSGNIYTVNLTGDAVLDAAYHIQLHDGGDSYTNAEDNISVLGSAGNDTISNSGKNVTIDGGAGNDSISNTAANVTIDGGAGENKIYNTAANVSIDVSKGNDVIEFAGTKSFTVAGFGAGDVIKPASGNLTNLTYTNSGVVASYRADGSNFDSQITIGGLSLSQESKSWSLDSGTANFIPTTLAGAYLNGGEIAYQVESVGSALVAISGVSNLDGIADVGKVIEVTGSAIGTGATVALNSNGYQFNLKGDWSGKTFTATANADVITNFAESGLTITTGDGADTIAITSNVTAVNITDFGTDDRLEFAAGISDYSYSDGALTVTLTDEQVVTVTGLSAPNNEATWLSVTGGNATYGTPAGLAYSVENNAITCASRAVNEEFVLSGLKSNATTAQISAAVDVDGTTITITDTTILDTSKIVTVATGYTLVLGDDIVPSEHKELSWTQDETDKTKYSYNTAGDTEGWRVVNNQIRHYDNSVEAFTISGLATTLTTENNASLPTGVTVDSGAVKISSGALNATDVELVGDFTLELDGVSAATTT